MSNFFQSTNINAGKYYQNGIEIDLGAQGAQGAQGIHGAAANQGAQGAQGSTGAQGVIPRIFEQLANQWFQQDHMRNDIHRITLQWDHGQGAQPDLRQ